MASTLLLCRGQEPALAAQKRADGGITDSWQESCRLVEKSDNSVLMGGVGETGQQTRAAESSQGAGDEGTGREAQGENTEHFYLPYRNPVLRGPGDRQGAALRGRSRRSGVNSSESGRRLTVHEQVLRKLGK